MTNKKSVGFEAFASLSENFLPKGSYRMTDEECINHYNKMGSKCFDLCPDGSVHDFKDNRENYQMCNAEYVCIKCGYHKRVDSSD
jgi:hypothetical protein